MQSDKGIVTGHFITHWGVPSQIRTLRLGILKGIKGVEGIKALSWENLRF